MENTSERALQRVGPLAELPALLSGLGVDPAEIIAKAGLEASELQADRYIPLPLFVDVLSHAALVTGRPDIAVQLGLRQTPSSLGPVGELMRLAPTLGDALSDFVSFQINNSRGAAVYLHRMGSDFALGIGVYDPAYRASSLAYDLSIAVGCSLIHHLSQGKVEPLEILLMRREPENTAPYRKLAGCPVRFDQPQSCIILSAQQLACSIPTADPAARAALLKTLHERLSQAPWGFTGQVRHALRPSLLLGKDSLTEIARALGLHRRTLERHLRLEGTSFDSIRDQVRFALARELLALTNLSIGEISVSLGYGSHSSFVHAFQRWAGMPPTRWRADCLPRL